MNDRSYTKLFSHIVTSSIWSEDSDTRVVWVTMMALKDQYSEVHASIPGLARAANVPLPACLKALDKFKSPDQFSRNKEYDGRRIEEIPGGWKLLNGETYRLMSSEIERKEYKRVKEQERRDRLRNVVDKNVDTHGQSWTNVTHADADADADAEVKQKPPKSPKGDLTVEFPPPLNTPKFKAAWADWEQHRREKKKPLTPLSIKMLFTKLQGIGVDRAIAAIEHSITQGWTGVYEDDKASGGGNGQHLPDEWAQYRGPDELGTPEDQCHPYTDEEIRANRVKVGLPAEKPADEPAEVTIAGLRRFEAMTEEEKR